MRAFKPAASVLMLALLVAAALPLGAAQQLPAPEKVVLKNGITVY